MGIYNNNANNTRNLINREDLRMGILKIFGLTDKEEKKLKNKVEGEEEEGNIFEDFKEEISELTLRQLLVFKKILEEEIRQAAKEEKEIEDVKKQYVN